MSVICCLPIRNPMAHIILVHYHDSPDSGIWGHAGLRSSTVAEKRPALRGPKRSQTHKDLIFWFQGPMSGETRNHALYRILVSMWSCGALTKPDVAKPREITAHWMDWVSMQTCQTPPGEGPHHERIRVLIGVW